jgi:hypothetical protein
VYSSSSERPEATGYLTYPAFEAYRDMRSVDQLAGILTYFETGADLIGTGSAERVRRLPVSAAYFDVLRARPTPGRGFLPQEELTRDSRAAVISHGL